MPIPKYLHFLLAAALAAVALPVRAQAPAPAPDPVQNPDEATRNAASTKILRDHAPLKTRWASLVSPTAPLPEYPRPQMVRREWRSLNGPWQFQEGLDGQPAPVGQTLSEKILVPFAMESQLSGIGRHAEHLWYRRSFSVPSNWRGGRLLLHFGAVDWETRVLVNGQEVGTHRGGYDPFTFDITDALKPGGEQEIIVGVWDPTDRADIPRGKQTLKPEGIFYTPVSGIWQSVWLEPVPTSSLESLQLTPDVDNGVLFVRAEGRGLAAGQTISAVAMRNGRRAGREASGSVSKPLLVPVPNARLWTPDQPNLYGLRVTLRQGKKIVDRVDSYFAMRKIELRSDGRVLRPMLNGKFVFQMGVLDQGYWPDGLYTAPTDEALKYDIEIAKKLGFNLLRKHAKVEPARWYYYCDRLGMLVWQDMPQGYNPNLPEPAKAQFKTELAQMVRNFGSFPSIIVWTLFNEGWGQHDTESLVSYLRSLDSTRLVNNASGWTDKGVGDFTDMHTYPPPKSPRPEPMRAAVLGEFGGLGMRAEGHMWKGESWGYQGLFSNGGQLTRRYEKYQRMVRQLRDDPGLSAAVYTQLTDVEIEANGLLSYDRAVIKPDASRVAAANRFQFGPIVPPQVLVPTSETMPQTWRYTFGKPADNWASPAFDDAAWKSGPGGFGTAATPNSKVGTEWSTSDIWARRSFEWSGAKGEPVFSVRHDEDIEIYINGVLAAKASGNNNGYEEMELMPEGRAAIKDGTNTLAFHVHQTTGGQIADVGLIVVH